jgi:putative membrane protein
MKNEHIIKKAEFNPKVCTYWLLSGTLTLTVTIIGIPLLILWVPLGLVFTKRYLDRMECVLTDRTLKVKKGILIRVEKTIPLEKITDMGMVQGPVMRYFGLHKLTVETAGQSGQGALVSLIGIEGAEQFRELVLNQRDALSDATPRSTPPLREENPIETSTLLVEIRDALHRIESKMEDRTEG